MSIESRWDSARLERERDAKMHLLAPFRVVNVTTRCNHLLMIASSVLIVAQVSIPWRLQRLATHVIDRPGLSHPILSRLHSPSTLLLPLPLPLTLPPHIPTTHKFDFDTPRSILSCHSSIHWFAWRVRLLSAKGILTSPPVEATE